MARTETASEPVAPAASAPWRLNDVPAAITERVKPSPQDVLAEVLLDFDKRLEQVRAASALPRRIDAVFLKAAAAVDRKKIAALQDHVRNLGDAVFEGTGGQYNYLDIARYLKIKAKHVVELRLDKGPPLSIFDLATGGGHFPFLAKQYGHKTIGIDFDLPTYASILEMYGIERIPSPIVRMEPMPVTGPFDLITGLQPMFNRNWTDRQRNFWTIDEWIWFVEYLSTLLRYPGRIYFSLNRYYVNKKDTTDDLLDLFEANGAYVEFSTRTVLFNVEKPLKLTK
jgi:hypothetical protein